MGSNPGGGKPYSLKLELLSEEMNQKVKKNHNSSNSWPMAADTNEALLKVDGGCKQYYGPTH